MVFRKNRYSIQDAAEHVGIPAWTLKRLEGQGRVPPSRRDGLSNWRYYTADDLGRLREAVQHLTVDRVSAAVPLKTSV